MHWASAALGLLVTAFMTLPLVLVVVFSFGQGAIMAFPIEGWTLEWYHTLLARPEVWGALENSLIITGSVAQARPWRARSPPSRCRGCRPGAVRPCWPCWACR